jgi:hypothetical protein
MTAPDNERRRSGWQWSSWVVLFYALKSVCPHNTSVSPSSFLSCDCDPPQPSWGHMLICRQSSASPCVTPEWSLSFSNNTQLSAIGFSEEWASTPGSLFLLLPAPSLHDPRAEQHFEILRHGDHEPTQRAEKVAVWKSWALGDPTHWQKHLHPGSHPSLSPGLTLTSWTSARCWGGTVILPWLVHSL